MAHIIQQICLRFESAKILPLHINLHFDVRKFHNLVRNMELINRDLIATMAMVDQIQKFHSQSFCHLQNIVK